MGGKLITGYGGDEAEESAPLSQVVYKLRVSFHCGISFLLSGEVWRTVERVIQVSSATKQQSSRDQDRIVPEKKSGRSIL